MADYWKSQARKFCDFCKCWIADNKPSIQFHETGKRHKENVAQKLAMLTKRSVKEKKESLKVDEEMRKMEEAAMKAYLKDMESNPDYTSKVIIDKVEEKKAQLEAQQLAAKDEEEKEKPVIPDDNIDGSPLAEEKVWYEAQSDEGYTYYWNYLTGESIWEPPKEGYVSIEEQKSSSSTETDNKETKSESEIVKKPVDDIAVNKEEEKIKKDNKKRKKDIDKEKQVEGPGDEVVVGPSMKPDPYGRWNVVDKTVPEPVDLQLPHQDYIEIKVPVIENEQPQIKFKEKMITSLDDKAGGPSTFKKRKFNSNRSNMRRKFDDDDE